MCLACKTQFSLPDYKKVPGRATVVLTGSDFRKRFEPDPDMLEKFGKFGVVSHVYLHNNQTNEIKEITLDDCEEIAKHAVAIISTGTNDWLDLWAVQWPPDYKPNLSINK